MIFDIHTDLEPGVEFDSVLVSASGMEVRDVARAIDYRPGVRLPGLSLPAGEHSFRVALRARGGSVLERNIVLRPGPGLLARFQAGQAVISSDVRGNDEGALLYREMTGEWFESAFSHVRSWAAAPLLRAGELIGYMSVARRDKTDPSYVAWAELDAR